MKSKIAFLLLLNILFCNGYSQKNLTDTLNLNEVVITGTKTGVSRKIVPISVSQISKQNIENSGQMNILPALNYFVPGIFVTERNILGFGVSTGSAGSISIRGVGGSPNTGVLVLVDGHPQYQGIFGHPLPDAYVASDVEKVEIIRGPGSILYGSNAMSGVINIITKKITIEALSGNFGASYGSFNTQKYYGTIGYKKDKLSVFASLNHDKSDGTREHTGFEISNGFTKIEYKINRHFAANADFNLAKFTASDNGPIGKPKLLNADITRGKTSFSIDNSYKNSEGSIKIYHNFGTHDLSDGFYSTDKNSGFMVFENFKIFKKSNLSVGADLKQYGGKANQGKSSNQYITINELAAYSYFQQEIVPKITLSAGFRIEHNAIYGTESIPLVGGTYNPTKQTTFKTSISKGFRSPTVMELYLFVPNPDLHPEHLVNYEVSWLQGLFNSHLNLELTAYRAKGENMIQVIGVYPNLKRDNVGKFTNQGLEFSCNYFVSRQLHINANYSYLDLSMPIVAAPRQQVNVNVNYQYEKCNLNISAQHIEKLYTELSPESAVYYTLLNARISICPMKRVDLFLMCNNLLNQKYEINKGYPMARFNFNGGVNYKF